MMNGLWSRARWRGAILYAATALAGATAPLLAQCADSARRTDSSYARLVFLGGHDADLMRLRNDLGACGGTNSLIRSALSLSDSLAGDPRGLRIAPVAPRLATTWNSHIPFSMDDGAMWAGRGTSIDITAGFRAERDHVTLIFAPEFTTSANLQITTLWPGNPVRSPFASPWHSAPRSQTIDMPQRFGDRHYTQLGLGQTTLETRYRGIGGGFTTENQWWGPAIQNALVMSDNAAGVPQVYLRTAHPARTPIGDVEGRILTGLLTESPFFDTDRRNDLRSLSAAVVTLRTTLDTGLTVGFAHAVYAALGTQADWTAHVADVFTYWNNDVPLGQSPSSKDQMISLFGRWVFPESGFEVYGEWAKLAFPKSLTELIVDPQRYQGYTMGLQWANPLSGGKVFRLQAELTMLEHTRDPTESMTPSFYLSVPVPQGYTQRGQVIGAAIGPGSSTQWLAADMVHPRWQLGITAGRIRWDDDAYYEVPQTHGFFNHDISLYAGLRGFLRLPRADVSASWTRTKRLNYLFQNPFGGGYFSDTFDVSNTTLNFTVVPHF